MTTLGLHGHTGECQRRIRALEAERDALKAIPCPHCSGVSGGIVTPSKSNEWDWDCNKCSRSFVDNHDGTWRSVFDAGKNTYSEPWKARAEKAETECDALKARVRILETHLRYGGHEDIRCVTCDYLFKGGWRVPGYPDGAGFSIRSGEQAAANPAARMFTPPSYVLEALRLGKAAFGIPAKEGHYLYDWIRWAEERIRTLEAELANKDKLWNAILSEAGMEEAKAWERWYHGHKRATVPKTLIARAEKAEAELAHKEQKLAEYTKMWFRERARAEKAEAELTECRKVSEERHRAAHMQAEKAEQERDALKASIEELQRQRGETRCLL